MSTRKLSNNESNYLVDILSNQAAYDLNLTPEEYFIDLVQAADLPSGLQRQAAGGWSGNPERDARRLVKWAESKGVNQANPKFTVLGSLLQVVLQRSIGLDEARWIAAFISTYSLYRDNALLDNLKMRYQVPSLVGALDSATVDLGPDIRFIDEIDEVELQSWLKPEPELQDVGFLKRAIEQAASVCRVEFDNREEFGTGFLITPTLLITNYHVLASSDADGDIGKNAKDAVLRFGKVTAANGKEAEGQTFRLNTDKPILTFSPVDKLDYVLLQVDASIEYIEDIRHVDYTTALPYKGMSLNILQHSEGEALKLGLSGNGVGMVYLEAGLVTIRPGLALDQVVHRVLPTTGK